MHLKIDENLPSIIAAILQDAGFESSTVYEQKLSGVKDMILAKHCSKNGYALITLDNDFSHTVQYPPKQHGGIIILRPKTHGRIAIVKFFEKFLVRFDVTKAKQKTIIVEEHHIRIRE